MISWPYDPAAGCKTPGYLGCVSFFKKALQYPCLSVNVIKKRLDIIISYHKVLIVPFSIDWRLSASVVHDFSLKLGAGGRDRRRIVPTNTRHDKSRAKKEKNSHPVIHFWKNNVVGN